MTELEFYLVVGVLFFAAYGFGLWDEERQRQKRKPKSNLEMFRAWESKRKG